MCLIAWRSAAASPWPLVLAANRDEFHGRATAPLHRWTQWPSAEGRTGTGRDRGAARDAEIALSAQGTTMLAGRDLVGGGTWLGVCMTASRIRVALLTNLRDGRAAPVAADAPSRGLLVTDVLAAPVDAATVLRRLAGSTSLPRMAGFNLVAIDIMPGDAHATIETSYLAHCGVGRTALPVCLVEDGVHGLSNGKLDEPWPKTTALKRALADAGAMLDREGEAAREQAEALLLAQLADRTPAAEADLPDTGIARARERWLSSAFLVDGGYGTRCSTVLAIDRAGRVGVLERRFDSGGQSLGDHREVVRGPVVHRMPRSRSPAAS